MRHVGVLYRALYCQLEAHFTLFCHLTIVVIVIVIIYFIFLSPVIAPGRALYPIVSTRRAFYHVFLY